MYYSVYLIESQLDKSWYIGFTTDPNRRLKEHNSKIGGIHTSRKGPWNLLYFESYLSKKDALRREKFLKTGPGRAFIKKQLRDYFLQNNS